MFVKICGITNEDDALFAVAMGADAVGFIFAPSTRQIAAQQVFNITRRLPPEILTVGVFRDELPSRVIETVNRAGLKAAQLHGHESPAMVAEVAEQIRWVIKAVSPDQPDARDQGFRHRPDHGRRPSGSGSCSTGRCSARCRGPRLICRRTRSRQCRDAVRKVQPWGVDVSSGVEAAPGRKDPMKVKLFIERARAAAPQQHLGPDSMPYDWDDDEE
jgi:phosphoribosylanthranilate isomerase